jgi:hypothetical protein
VDARIRVAAVEVLRRLLDAVPRRGLRRSGRRGRGALADLGPMSTMTSFCTSSGRFDVK